MGAGGALAEDFPPCSLLLTGMGSVFPHKLAPVVSAAALSFMWTCWLLGVDTGWFPSLTLSGDSGTPAWEDFRARGCAGKGVAT